MKEVKEFRLPVQETPLRQEILQRGSWEWRICDGRRIMRVEVKLVFAQHAIRVRVSPP